MSFRENFKRAKKNIVMGVLALAAVIATPAKGETKEATPTEKDAVVAIASKDAVRQKMFEDAVRSGAAKEDIARYVDFPEFVPVTKDGRYDGKKAGEYAKTLAPYIKTLAEKGETVSAAEAYKIFKETTGQKNVSLEDFNDVKEMAKRVTKWQGSSPVHGTIETIAALILAGVTLVAAGGSLSSGSEGIRRFRRFKVFDGEAWFVCTVAAAIAVVAAKSGMAVGSQAWKEWTRTPEKSVCEIYEGTYNNYLNHAVKTQKQQFQKLEWEQAKQLIQNAQQKQ